MLHKTRTITLILAISLTSLLGYGLSNTTTEKSLKVQAASVSKAATHQAPLRDASIKLRAKYWTLQRTHLKEWRCMSYIIYKESRWIPNLHNTQGSGAYGLGQVKGSYKYTANKPLRQYITAVKYAIARYGTLCRAKHAHVRQGWY